MTTDTTLEKIKIEDLPTVYDAKSTEEKMYKFWEDGGFFKADAKIATIAKSVFFCSFPYAQSTF